MTVYRSAAELISQTPLLELTEIERIKGQQVRVLAKFEYLDPAGAAKDRVAEEKPVRPLWWCYRTPATGICPRSCSRKYRRNRNWIP